MTTRETRCSSLPRIWQCPASAQQTGPAIDLVSDAGQMGTAVHAVLAARAHGITRDNWHTVTAQIANAYQVDPDELLRLADAAWEMRNQLYGAAGGEGPISQAIAERALSAELAPGLQLTGHLDVLFLVGNRATIIDYKTGRRGDLSDPEHQLRGYAWLDLKRHPHIERVTACAVWVHERTYTTYQMARADMDAWCAELLAKLTDPNPKYGPGESVCRYCPHQATCEARLALLKGALAVIDGGGDFVISDRRLLAAHEAVTAIETKLKQFRGELRARIHRDGPIVADGKRLSLQEVSVSEIDPQRAWPVLAAYLSEDEMAQCVKLRKRELVKCVRSKATRGKKAAEDDFMGQLADENAITYTTQHRLTLKKEE
jgi:RecB family exonuclease